MSSPVFREDTMRNASTATVALIVAIALYFTMSWGLDGFRALTAPNYGLDDVWRSQLVFDAGRLLHLSPIGVIKLAAFLAAMKLAVAGICGSSLPPAVWSGNAESVREYAIHI